jgi:hypothetical protein
MILIFMVDGARADSSFCMRSAMPGNMVVLQRCKRGECYKQTTHARVMAMAVHMKTQGTKMQIETMSTRSVGGSWSAME